MKIYAILSLCLLLGGSLSAAFFMSVQDHEALHAKYCREAGGTPVIKYDWLSLEQMGACTCYGVKDAKTFLRKSRELDNYE